MRYLLLAIILFRSVSLTAQSLENDRLALVSLYNSTDGEQWTNKTGWTVPGSPGDNPCGWYGVSCIGDRVIDLDLFGNNLVGSIPPDLVYLSSLQYLDMTANNLSGIIPKELGNLYQLRGLSLSSNKLSGSIPAELGNLSLLQNIFLNNNLLSGNIPHQLGNLLVLRTLYLNTNQLTGSIPSELSNLNNLTILNLHNNKLTGSIPIQLGGLTQLTYISLSKNQFTGTIPEEFGNLTLIGGISLYSNQLTGTIPTSLGQLNNLGSLLLDHNNLSGNIPPELCTLPNLRILWLSYNEFTGSIPKEVNELSLASLLYFDHNQLSGNIPDLQNVPSTADVYFDNNKLTFNGMESNIDKIDSYSPQSKIPLNILNSTLSVDAGGTITNNTYKWYKDGLIIATVVGNNTYTIQDSGIYRAEVTNSIATQLNLISENYVQSIPLPVTLINFTAKHSSEGNQLQWSTTSETNNAGFEIERSDNAKSFEKIGFTDGKGESGSMHSYQFTDPNPFSVSYYRLKQLDYDGTSAYSHIIRVRSEVAALKVYPNPVKGQVSIESDLENETVQIYDLKGIQILKKPVLPLQTISTANWQTGTYMVGVGDKIQKIFVEN